MDNVKISDENIDNIIKVFLVGYGSKKNRRELITDGKTYCTWDSVLRLRRPIAIDLIHKNVDLFLLGSILKILWKLKEIKNGRLK